jgi:hypothetical protein
MVNGIRIDRLSGIVMGRMKTLNRKWRAAKSKNEIREGIIRGTDPGLMDLKRPGDIQVKVNDKVKIGKLYYLIFTITMKSCFSELVCRLMGRVRGVLVIDDKIMQNDLRSNAESKNQQHHPAQNSPYGCFL